MDVEKLRNLTDAELAHQERELNDQLFRMKFQLKMGQTESLNKIHGLRKDVARIKTILREKQLGLAHGSRQTAVAADTAAAEQAAPAVAAPARAQVRRGAQNCCRKKSVRGSQGKKEIIERQGQSEEEVNGRDNQHETEPPQHQDWPGRLNEDGQDDCGRDGDEEVAPALPPRGCQEQEVLRA